MKLDIKDLDKLQNGVQDLLQKGVQKGVDGLNKGIDYINNIDGSGDNNNAGDKAPSTCTKCGAQLNLDTDKDVIVCEYCGASYNNKKGNDPVNTILEFVEKQQTKMEEKAERDKEERFRREQELRERREEHKRRKRRRSVFRIPGFFILLIVLYILTINGYIPALEPIVEQIKILFKQIISSASSVESEVVKAANIVCNMRFI